MSRTNLCFSIHPSFLFFVLSLSCFHSFPFFFFSRFFASSCITLPISSVSADSVQPLKPSFSLHSSSPLVSTRSPCLLLPLRSPLASPPVRVWCGLCKAGACLSEIPLLSATLTHTAGRAGDSTGEEQQWVGPRGRRDCFSSLPVSPAPLFSFSFPFSVLSINSVGRASLVWIAFLSAWALPPPSSSSRTSRRLIGSTTESLSRRTSLCATTQTCHHHPSLAAAQPPADATSLFRFPCRALAWGLSSRNPTAPPPPFLFLSPASLSDTLPRTPL